MFIMCINKHMEQSGRYNYKISYLELVSIKKVYILEATNYALMRNRINILCAVYLN